MTLLYLHIIQKALVVLDIICSILLFSQKKHCNRSCNMTRLLAFLLFIYYTNQNKTAKSFAVLEYLLILKGQNIYMKQDLQYMIEVLASGQPLTKEEAVQMQEQMLLYADFKHTLNFENVQTVAGVDLAYWNYKEEEYGVCSIVLLDYASKQVIGTYSEFGKINFPYIPGCLAFREIPLILKTLKKLNQLPDLFLFDGNGYLHPRHMGIATQAGICIGRPAIGVAKSYYKIGEIEYQMPENYPGAFQEIKIDGEIYGCVLRTLADVRPIFVSVGNQMNLEDAVRIAKYFITKESHIPIPTRMADLETHKMRSYYQSLQQSADPASVFSCD